MRHWLPLLLLGCYPELTPQALCDEVVHAASLRSLECTGDIDQANARGEALAELGCTARRIDDPVWDCPRTLYEAHCDDVTTLGDDPGYWLSLHPTCVSVLGAPGGGSTTATTPWNIPTFTGVGSCLDPFRNTLLGTENGLSFTIDTTYGDSVDHAPTCLAGAPTRDYAVLMAWDDASPLAVWGAYQGDSEVAVSVLTGGDACTEAVDTGCTVLPSDGSWVQLTQGSGLGGFAEALFVVSSRDPDASVTAQLAVRPLGGGPP